MKFFLKQIPIYFLFFALLISSLTTYFVVKSRFKSEIIETNSVINTSTISNSCNVNFTRLKGRELIRPLLFAERTCEAEKFYSMKTSLNDLIQNLKTSGQINSASVYVRMFQNGEWISLNGEQKYMPGSLFKVPLLMTYLRMAEKDNSIMSKKYQFTQITEESKELKQEFLKTQIKLGSSYTVKELMRYMIAHSDNNATMLLMNNIPISEFEKTFSDLGMNKELTKSEAIISAQEYSEFWLALFNGSYLSFDNSEFALRLLTESDFNDGITKGIPKNIKIAHKFGEKGDSNSHGFHETGIVYLNNSPYLISVMTNGNDQNKLPGALKQISTVVYNNMERFNY